MISVARRAPIVAASLFTGSAVLGAELEPTIALGIVRTDNLTLAETNPEAQTVYQLVPQLAVSQQSARLMAQAIYRLEAYKYRQRDDDEAYSLFDGEVEYELVPNRLSLDSGASRSEAIRDPLAAIPNNNLVVSVNRIGRNDLYFGPTFSAPMGGNAVMTGELRRTLVKYEEAVLPNGEDRVVEDYGEFNVDNYRRGRGFTWALGYDFDASDYGAEIVNYEYRRASAEVGLWAAQNTRLFVSGGKESSWDNPLDPSLADSFWEVGFAREVSEKVRAEFAVGERTFGQSRRGEFSVAFGAGGESVLTYLEAPTTNTGDDYGPDLLNPDEISNDLVHIGMAERYINKSFRWTLRIDRERTGLSFTLFDDAHEQRTLDDGTPLADESQTGGAFTWSWKLGPRTELSLVRSSSVREVSLQEIDEEDTSIQADYQLGSRTSLSFTLARRAEQADDPSLGISYEANNASLQLIRAFK